MYAIILKTDNESKELRVELIDDDVSISIVDLVNWQNTKLVSAARVNYDELVETLAILKPTKD